MRPYTLNAYCKHHIQITYLSIRLTQINYYLPFFASVSSPYFWLICNLFSIQTPKPAFNTAQQLSEVEIITQIITSQDMVNTCC